MKTNEKNDLRNKWKEPVFQGRNVLVVDDVKINYLLIKAMLLKTGAKVIWAEDGFKALDLAHGRDKIDVVLMDYNMPEMNGLETTFRLKEIDPALPVISQSTFTDSRQFDRSNAPFDAYLAKPILAETLIAEIDRLILLSDSGK